MDNNVLPVLGDHFVDMITRDDLVSWRDSMTGAAPATINNRTRVLKTVLRAAHDDGLTHRDPTRGLPALREQKAKKSITAEELGRLLKAAQDLQPVWYPMFCTMAFSGLRFGEVTALRWSDIDTSNMLIRVAQAQVKGVVDETKTGVTRTVPLSSEMLDVLLCHREAQREVKLNRLRRKKVADISEAARDDDGWVFPAQRRGVECLMHTTATRKPLLRCAKAAGIDLGFSNHWFRHTYNNLMRTVAQGVVLRSMTGHSSETMSDHYSHVGAAEKHAALSGLIRLVAPSPIKVGDKVGDEPQTQTRG